MSFPEDSSINDFIENTDIASAFQILLVHPDDHELLGIQFQDQFYYDKCLSMAMGGSISCSIFESFSTALKWIACKKFVIPQMLHVLDDFLFIWPQIPLYVVHP